MPRYKGRTGPKGAERDYPYIVEMGVPPGGLGKRLDAMYAFHADRGIQGRHGRGRREEGRDYIRWCFADAATAADFKSRFGGFEPMPTDDPIALIEWGKRNVQK